MCLAMLSNKAWEKPEEIPPHKLQFDCSGSITLTPRNAIIEGGEIKSSSSRKHTFSPYEVWLPTYYAVAGFNAGETQLFRRFELLAFALPKLYSGVEYVSVSGWAYVSYSHENYGKPMVKSLEEEE